MDINYLNDLKRLEDIILLIDNNVRFNINMFWTALLFILTASGAALVLIAKTTAKKAAETKAVELQKVFDEKYNLLLKYHEKEIAELKEKSLDSFGENANGSWIRWSNGLQICTKTIKNNETIGMIPNTLVYPASFNSVSNIQVTALNTKDSRVEVLNYDESLINIGIDTNLKSGSEISILIFGTWK